jgi:hypothetical protein
MMKIARLVILASSSLAIALAGGPTGAATTPAPARVPELPPLPPVAVPARFAGQFAGPQSEIPPLDPETDIQTCAVCRLAAATTSRLPNDAFRVESQVIEYGATLRLVSADPTVRDALWQATVARGQLLAALRAGSGVHLCAWCRERHEMLPDLEISARRIPEGVFLVYTSASPAVVRQIQMAVRAGSDVPL